MNKWMIICIALLVTSCASVKPTEFNGPNGRPAYSMNCSGKPDACYKTAGKLCNNGYEVISTAAGTIGIPVNGTTAMHPRYNLVIECKEPV